MIEKSQHDKITFVAVESRGDKEDTELELEFLRICNGENRFKKVLPFKEGDRVHNSVSHVATAQIQIKKIADLEAKLPTLTEEADIAKAKKDISVAQQVKFSNIINAILCVFFMFATTLVIIATLGICFGKIRIPLKETPYVRLDSLQKA